MDRFKYVLVLADHEYPHMQIISTEQNGIIQNDNAASHTVKFVRVVRRTRKRIR